MYACYLLLLFLGIFYIVFLFPFSFFLHSFLFLFSSFSFLTGFFIELCCFLFMYFYPLTNFFVSIINCETTAYLWSHGNSKAYRLPPSQLKKNIHFTLCWCCLYWHRASEPLICWILAHNKNVIYHQSAYRYWPTN